MRLTQEELKYLINSLKADIEGMQGDLELKEEWEMATRIMKKFRKDLRSSRLKR